MFYHLPIMLLIAALFYYQNSYPTFDNLEAHQEVEILHLRHRGKRVPWCIPLVPLGLKHTVFCNTHTSVLVFLRLAALFGEKADRVGIVNGRYSSIEIYDKWFESTLELTLHHHFNLPQLKQLIGSSISYRLGLHGPGLENNDQELVHSFAGKLVFSDKRDIQNKVLLGIAVHINKTGHYMYAEKRWRGFPFKDMAVGIGAGIGPGERYIAPEIFVKIPLGNFFEYIYLPTLKVGIRKKSVFIRFGSE